MESGFGVVRLRDGVLQVVPGVHDVVSVTVIVEVLALKDQSQSPAERRREFIEGITEKSQHTQNKRSNWRIYKREINVS